MLSERERGRYFGPALSIIGSHARDLVLQRFKINSCVASTRVVTRVLREFGYEADPLMVRVRLFNRAYVEAVKRGDSLEQAERAGAKCVCIEHEDGSPGHTVAIIKSNRTLIDIALDQANRPAKGIIVPEFVITQVCPEFLTGEYMLRFEHEDVGCLIEYTAFPDDHRWRVSPDWQKKSRTDPIVQQLVDAIKAVVSARSGLRIEEE
jgi:hypothetical protein